MSSTFYKRVGALIFFIILSLSLKAQDHVPVNGVRDDRNSIYAFENATIHKTGSDILENGMLLVQDGKIVYVGPRKEAPRGSVLLDLNGQHIYPSFIDLYSQYGIIAKKPGKEARRRGPQLDRSRKGPVYWNDAIRADYS